MYQLFVSKTQMGLFTFLRRAMSPPLWSSLIWIKCLAGNNTELHMEPKTANEWQHPQENTAGAKSRGRGFITCQQLLGFDWNISSAVRQKGNSLLKRTEMCRNPSKYKYCGINVLSNTRTKKTLLFLCHVVTLPPCQWCVKV